MTRLNLIALAALASSAIAAGIPPASDQIPFGSAQLSSASIPSINSFALAEADRAQLVAHIASLPERRWIRLAEGAAPVLISEGEKALLALGRTRFEDVHDEVLLGAVWANAAVAGTGSIYPEKLGHNATELKGAFETVDLDEMEGFLAQFTGFFNRYYRSPTGRESQVWLLEYLKKTAAKINPKAKVTFSEVTHSWSQNSIIVTFEPSKSAKAAAPVVLSAHLDSTAQLPFLRAPGADDDGSAVTVLVTAFAALLQQGFVPTSRPLELHFYAAEEGGLLGSKEVARGYAEAGKAIHGLLHMDQVAYIKPGTEASIGVLGDVGQVDPDLTSFLKKVITEYADVPYADTICGYACSDHSSWAGVKLPSSCISEGKFPDANHQTHSSSDTPAVRGFSFAHMAQFVKVCLGFALELAELEVAA